MSVQRMGYEGLQGRSMKTNNSSAKLLLGFMLPEQQQYELCVDVKVKDEIRFYALRFVCELIRVPERSRECL